MNQIPLVIGFHKKKKAIEIERVGICCICDGTVYLAKQGVTGELEIFELAKLNQAKLIGFECVMEIVMKFELLMKTPKSILEKVKQDLLKEGGK